MNRIMRNNLILLALFCVMGVWAFFQPFPAISVDVGGDMRSGLRDLDTPYIAGFWPVEPRPWTPQQGAALRWSRDAWQVQWPHAGFGWWQATMRIDLSGRNATNPARVTWQQPTLGTIQLSNTPRLYRMLLHTRWSDTPTIVATVNPFYAGNDSRGLGIAVTRIAIAAVSYQLPGVAFAWLLVVLTWCWWISTRFAWWGIGAGLLGTLIYTTLPEWVLVHSTLGIWLTGGAVVMSVLCTRMRWLPWAHVQLIAGMGVAQLLALWSPWLRSSDIAMHVRMLRQVLAGNLLFTAQLPCEAGAYISPYPPLTYMVVAPFAMISGNTEFLRMMLMGMAVFFNISAVIYMAHVVLHHPSLQRYHGWFLLLAGMNYPLLRAIHTGEMSNALAHGIVTIAIISWIDQRASLWGRIVLSSMALLAHTGNSITFGLMVGLLAIQHVLMKRPIPAPRQLAVMSIPVVLMLIYYVNFMHLIGQAPGYAGCPPDIPLWNRLAGLQEVVPSVLLCSTALGLFVHRDQRMRVVLVAGLGAAVIAAGMLVVTTQTVRWGLSVMPFLALATALPLSRLWRYGWAGRLCTHLAMVVFVWLMYSNVWHRILHYLHD